VANADYRLCDNCTVKAFYDCNLNYETGEPPKVCGVGGGFMAKLDNLGDWAVLCRDCATTHRTLIAPITPVAWMVYSVDGASVRVTDNPHDIADGERALPLYTGGSNETA
jgi:hypothetical protein